jgi:hypothetical protein
VTSTARLVACCRGWEVAARWGVWQVNRAAATDAGRLKAAPVAGHAMTSCCRVARRCSRGDGGCGWPVRGPLPGARAQRRAAGGGIVLSRWVRQAACPWIAPWTHSAALQPPQEQHCMAPALPCERHAREWRCPPSPPGAPPRTSARSKVSCCMGRRLPAL